MGIASFLPSLVADQLWRTPAAPTRSFASETVIVTGSNSGLGKAAAEQLVRLGAARVILAVRTVSKGEQAKDEIEKATGRTGVLDVWELDMSSYASVQAFARRATADLDRIDAVVENAGMWTEQFRRAEDNEVTLTVNVLSTLLLMLLLLPKLRAVAKSHGTAPRVSLVSSDLYDVAPLKARGAPHVLDDMNDQAKADMASRYMDSKLLLTLYLLRLFDVQRAAGKPDSDGGVIINYLNPGLCYSGLARETDSAGFRAMQKALARTTDEGARTLVYAAAGGPETHGKYMRNGTVKDINSHWRSSKEGRALSEKVFVEVNEKLESIVPGVTKDI